MCKHTRFQQYTLGREVRTQRGVLYLEGRLSYHTVQGIIKIYKECISAFRSINSNGHIEHKIPTKKNLSMRLDKRLYSKMSIDGISLCSEKSNRRAVAEIVKFPRLIELFKKFPTQDPLIFKREGKFFLSIPFDAPEIPTQNDTCIGVDLGERRFAITSDGIMFNDKEYNARRRKLRYLKRCLHKKGTKSARRHKGKLSIKEMNQSTDMCYKVANAIIDSTNNSFIILEDLSNIKKNTSKSKEGFKKKIITVDSDRFPSINSNKSCHTRHYSMENE